MISTVKVSDEMRSLGETLLTYLAHQKCHRRMQKMVGGAVKTDKGKVLLAIDTLSAPDSDKNYLKRQITRLSRRVR